MINGKRIMRLNENLIDIQNNKFWIDYFASHTVHHQPDNPVSRFVLYCGMRHMLKDDFEKCHKEFKVTGA